MIRKALSIGLVVLSVFGLANSVNANTEMTFSEAAEIINEYKLLRKECVAKNGSEKQKCYREIINQKVIYTTAKQKMKSKISDLTIKISAAQVMPK